MNTMLNIYVEMGEYFTEEHIRGVLALHPVECIFELDAPRKIAQRLSGKTALWWIENENRKEFIACWHASEIYCPHEGIDRRAELGIKTLDWETV
jgi:hypothetical protein